MLTKRRGRSRDFSQNLRTTIGRERAISFCPTPGPSERKINSCFVLRAAGNRRCRSRCACRSIMHDEWLYRHEETQSNRKAQRLFLHDAWQNFRARVFRWTSALAAGVDGRLKARSLHRAAIKYPSLCLRPAAQKPASGPRHCEY
jgi:hypothetical protein